MKRLTFILFVLFIILSLTEGMAQVVVTLSGKVTSSDGSPVAQATLAVEGTSCGTYSDNNGNYTLSLSEGKYTVSASFVGFKSQKKNIELDGNKVVNFVLQEDAVGLKDVEIYAKSKSQKLRESSFAVNALDVKPIVNSLNNLNELVNRASGIKVRQEGGVGSDFDLSINGMSGNSVRYFIDGVPLETKGSEVSLANIPVNIIDHIEMYKGVVPSYLGSDALGGAINIVTKKEKKNYLDVSYGIGSFHTHKVDMNAQIVFPKSGLIVRPTVGVNYSKNDYMMKGVEVWDESVRKYVPSDRKRFHDDYFSLLAQVEVGVKGKSWADDFFVTASYSKINKELQTGSIQTKVYGMAERQGDAYNISAQYRKKDFILKGLQMQSILSHTWDHSLTVDTAYRVYDWNGDYIESSRNEITGREKSLRHYKRPTTMFRSNWDYRINQHHSVNLNYLVNRTGNDRYDDVDDSFVPSNDIVCKHIIGLSYNQQFLQNKIENTFFVKDYINHLNIRQTDLYWQTGSDEVMGSNTNNYWGYGVGTRVKFLEPVALKASFEHSVRLPLARELLGNGSTIYANTALDPERSDNVNVGAFGTWHPAAGHSLYYEVNGFIRFVDDYIQAVVAEKEGMMQYENVPAVHIKGVEGEVRYSWKRNLQCMANVSWQDARDQRKYKDDGKLSATYLNRVPNRPWLFGAAEANYTFYDVLLKNSTLRLGTSYQWVHWYFLTWEAYGAIESKARIPAQHVINADITYSLENGKYNISVSCDNIFDKLVYDHYKLQKPGRSFFLKFRMFLN
ncbi:carboxypeptidase-like regulatory domain-containing protein [Bacteroides caecigallinarum]|uniref:TonB-dependent receptor n=1 Tax=Bacteroides caecigallinarum TaxID=1411144 RepID=UPI001F17F75D|nr:TonB-dependent receptor [Bacteroides caecigallinarum]MCF2592761.1 carboxypeptidase-like regulatory domain-containing protein [Bacteroides caecigallinarum]